METKTIVFTLIENRNVLAYLEVEFKHDQDSFEIMNIKVQDEWGDYQDCFSKVPEYFVKYHNVKSGIDFTKHEIDIIIKN